MDKYEKLQYLYGLGNTFESEAISGSLPKGRNNPQRCPYDLYAEELSGCSFTTPRYKNLRSWLYKATPTCNHSRVKDITSDYPNFISDFETNDGSIVISPEQFRWKPFKAQDEKSDFFHSIYTYAGCGTPNMKNGMSIHMYACTKPMDQKSAFYSSDGDFLIVPQEGELFITTEFGKLNVRPKDIAVVPRGVRFRVDVLDGVSNRGYICEVYGGHFALPELGPIGTNGLANPKDFEIPVAAYENIDKEDDYVVINKYQGRFFQTVQKNSVFNTVAWTGNYYPFKYNLDKFNTIGTISFDHPDPSIFTVMTCPTNEPGVALCDFVIFPPRWLVGEDTFRPPYYHRNTMSEFMGNICGVYDAKEEGFVPGSASLHSCMAGHGPEAQVFEKASTVELKPSKVGEGSLAFMFETTFMLRFPKGAIADERLDTTYMKSSWSGLKNNFKNHEVSKK